MNASNLFVRTVFARLVLGMVCGCTCAMRASGADIHVPGDYATIQAAVNAADPLDTIIVANGTYTGIGNRDILIDKNVTVRSASLDPTLCIIDCEGAGRGFKVFGNTSTQFCQIEGFTITNGFAWPEAGVSPLPELLDTEGGGSEGGAINLRSPATVRNCHLISNATAIVGAGGAIIIGPNGTSVIEDCIIQDNLAGGGGGILCRSAPQASVVQNCQILDNVALMRGGGVHCLTPDLMQSANLVLIGCTIQGNRAGPWNSSSLPLHSWGGGIYVHSGNVKAVNCTIQSNHALPGDEAVARGAGIGIFEGYISLPTTVELTNCLIANNVVGLESSSSPELGGGIFNSGGQVHLMNCTIAHNGQQLGHEYYQEHSSGEATSTFENCIFWGSEEIAAVVLDDTNDAVEFRHCNVMGGLDGILGNAEPSVYANNIDEDPRFIDVSGGNFMLQYFSPCLNQGNPTLLPPDEFDLDGDNNFTEPIPFDLAMQPRQFNPGNCVDLGAFENSTAGTPGCTSDITGASNQPDGAVGVADLLAVISAWGTSGGIVDFTPAPCGDGIVNVSELLAVINNWGECGGTASQMPQTVSECFDVYCAGLQGEAWTACLEKCLAAVCSQSPPPEGCE